MNPPDYKLLSIIACRADKRPMASWKINQSQIIPPKEADAYGIVCGAVSGNLECIDYDKKADANGDITWDAFCELVENTAPFLMERLVIQKTPSDGRHVIYRCKDAVDGNRKLACPNGQLESIFETRGEGGYFVCAPSPGYVLIQGDFNNIPTITNEERTILIRICQSFGELSDVEPIPIASESAHASASIGYSGGLSPLDDYDQRGDVLEVLRKHGWKISYKKGHVLYLCRPNKPFGISATFNFYGNNRLHVFSSSTIFTAGRSYKPSSVYGILEHDGDFKRAARQLVSEGYGKKGEKKKNEDVDIIACAYRGVQGDADLLVHLLKDKACYDSITEQYFIFDGPHARGHWHKDLGDGILNIAINHLVAAYTTELEEARKVEALAEADFLNNSNSNRDKANEARKKNSDASKVINLLHKRINELRKPSYIRSVLDLTRDRIVIYGNEWDTNPMILGVPNGVVNLRDGSLRPAEPKDYIRRICATEYDPNAEAPRFHQFLLEIFAGDEEIKNYMLRLLGYGITGLTTEHVYPIFYGADGRNGKDTLLDVLFRTLGTQIAKPVSPDTVIGSGKRNTGSATPELYDLYGARIVWINETEESDRIKPAQLKALSGGTIIKCRPLHGNLIEFEPTHLMLLVSNYKPQAPSHDEAFWSRIHLVPFTQRFIDEPQKPNEHLVDRTLGDKLQSERKGILTALVQGCMAWQKRTRLDAPRTLIHETKQYRKESDIFSEWIDDCCDQVGGQKEKASILYQSHKNWCLANGYYVPSSKMFAIRMEEHGYVRHVGTGNVKYWLGLAVKQDQIDYRDKFQ